MIDFNMKKISHKVNNANLHATPVDIADSMIELLVNTEFFDEPNDSMTAEDYISSHRVLDIYCKSGSLLYACYKRFMIALRHIIPNKDDRDYFIVRNLLYGVCPSINCINTLRDMFYNNKKYDLSYELGNFFLYDLEKEEGSDKDIVKELLKPMKFDVVVGNPPYNNDVYLDFVMLGHRLAKTYDLWITPAKFQNKRDNSKHVDKNVDFREIILPCISDLVYYPETRDIFDILNRGGIAYYLCNRSSINVCNIVNISKTCKYLNSSEKRNLQHSFCFLNFINNLVTNKIDISDNLSMHIDTDKSPYGLVVKVIGSKVKSNINDLTIRGSYGNVLGFLPRTDLKKGFNSVDKYKCITTAKSGGAEIYKTKDDSMGRIIGLNTLYKYNPSEVCSGDYFVAFSGAEFEVDSFISYMSTKLVNFLYFAHCSNSNINEFCFDLVPIQSWDKIYEDKPLIGYTPDENGIYTDKDGVVHCSLYVKYKLTQQEIGVIESVIRERK